jgi:hypothetical protein
VRWLKELRDFISKIIKSEVERAYFEGYKEAKKIHNLLNPSKKEVKQAVIEVVERIKLKNKLPCVKEDEWWVDGYNQAIEDLEDIKKEILKELRPPNQN